MYKQTKLGKDLPCDNCKKIIYCKLKKIKRNTNFFCSRQCRAIFFRGKHFSPKTEFKNGMKVPHGNKHHSWNGMSINLNSKHLWILRNFPSPNQCMNCGIERQNYFIKNGKRPKRNPIEWANISGQYLREVTDYVPLCMKCHHKWDLINEKGWKTRHKF